MTTVPFYNILIVPGVRIYFQNDYFRELARKDAEIGEDILFLMLKEDKERDQMGEEDFYPIGLAGKVESIDDDGNIGIRTLNRVNIKEIEISNGEISAEGELR